MELPEHQLFCCLREDESSVGDKGGYHGSLGDNTAK